MKYIKTFESVEDDDYNQIKDIISDYTIENKLDRNFSSGGYWNKDCKRDIDEFYEFMKNKNIDVDRFIKRHWNRIFSDDFFIANCGFLDSLLYQFDKTYPIGGSYELKEIEKDSLVCEHIIKYDYGYQNHYLSRAYILQSYSTLEDFYFACATIYDKGLFNSDYSPLATKEWVAATDNYDFYEISNLFMMPIKLKVGSISFIDLGKAYEMSNPDLEFEDFVKFFKDIKMDVVNYEEEWCVQYFGTDDFDWNSNEEIENLDIDDIRNELELRASTKKYNL